ILHGAFIEPTPRDRTNLYYKSYWSVSWFDLTIFIIALIIAIITAVLLIKYYINKKERKKDDKGN
ncbi:MAG: hypothetical protein J6Z36_03565, partial [Clostridia bacterium]|nr:hypothetical protein [Clostridia bacterium]